MTETVAFYSDAKAYTTYLGEEADQSLELPQEALNATEVKDVFNSANQNVDK